ncbi:LXG domain-containing protein [Enterococcus rivorum]|uniref:LXG domain-containing protein n=1 Tax=Enterococcus rivorum TaxID=762845 RepID=UPI001FDA5D0D|nr:LXG domain-containing protein [Enterococcus rivorum]MBP2100664.1 hypothetical protein [Enterococcus rivorum]
METSAAVARALSRMNPVANILDSLLNIQKNLNQMAESLEGDIRELEDKLEKLREFSAETSGLFTNSLSDMKLAMQGVAVLNITVANPDGTYSFPEGFDKSWFDKIKSKSELEKSEEKAIQASLKQFNDLYAKNPAAAIKKVKNNDRLLGYILSALDSGKLPEKAEEAILGIFIAQETWSVLPKKLASDVLNSPKFGLYLSKASYETQAAVYGALIKLSDKGWDVLAPIGNVTNILSKSSAGEKLIAGSKIAFNKFNKLKPVAEFLKKHKMATEVVSVVGDGFTVSSLAYKEYINPKSPAYGDVSKALYGGENIFFIEAGPLEGAQYGGPVGAFFGTANYFAQGGGLSDIYGVNKIPYVKDVLNWVDDKHTFLNEEDKRNWINEQYDIYEKRHEGLKNGDYSGFKIPNSEYKPGVPSHSGSSNFNPNTNNNIFPNGGN